VTLSASQNITPGTKVGPYEIVSWLGAGGMGVVYRARDARLGRDVALKLIPPSLVTDETRLRRFEQEARAAGQLNHPNIVAVHDVGVHAGAPYIVTELLDGESLRSCLESGPLPARKVVDYARQTAAGLAAAHDKGVVHRDVKPDNLFITADGRIKILDFGIAKLTTPDDDRRGRTGLPTETAEGMVVGTAGYMSPEQVRGEPVDARSDIFSLGAVVHEMLTGHPAFDRATVADTMSAILKEDPSEALPDSVSPALARIVARCLEKTRETRFQSARDLAFGLEVLSDTAATAVPAAVLGAPRHWRTTLAVAVVVLSVLAAVASWLTRATEPPPFDNPLANARFTRFTDWEGTESGARISPDGKFVAFLADRDGQFDIWLSQVGTGDFRNLTESIPPLRPQGSILWNFGFSGDGAEIWFSVSGDPGLRKMLMPLIGGAPRAFLDEGNNSPSWSPDGTRLAYFNNTDGDPLFVADHTGADARQILGPDEKRVLHNHNPVWSPDGQWIYFVRGLEPTDEMDVWRVRPSGGLPERLTEQHAVVNFLAPIDPRTLLYVARAKDRSGPWLWALDVASKVTRRVSSGPDQYTSVAASRDGRRIVATIANPTASLWTVPILARLAEDRDVQRYPVTTVRALAPRFGGTSLFYLSARGGTGDGLWRFHDGEASEVWKGADRPLSEPAMVSPGGGRVAVVVRQEGKRHLAIMSADGTNARTLAASLDMQGEAGQATGDWSPDGAWIVTGGRDAQGQALFKIPVDGGAPVRLVAGQAVNPVWSPDGNLIVYSSGFMNGQATLLGVRPDGASVELPPVRIRQGGYRFLPDGTGLVYLPLRRSLDFWLLDLATKRPRQLTRLSDQGSVQTFDITPDGKQIVFDRSRENSNITLIDLPK
jgi:serine/threonine protein kinase/Tol biopolymer transport system component